MLTVFGVQAVSSVETFNDFAVSVVLVGCSLLCALLSFGSSLLLPFVVFVCCIDFRSFVASLLSPSFFSVSCVFWLFGYVQRFLSYQTSQGFQGLHVFFKLSYVFPISLGIRKLSRLRKTIEKSHSRRYTLLESGIPPGGNCRMELNKYASAFHRRSRKLKNCIHHRKPEHTM